MNTRQAIAYSSPSAEPEDTAKPRFAWFTDIDGRHIRLCLTVNVGFE